MSEKSALSLRRQSEPNAAILRLSAVADLSAAELAILNDMSRKTRVYLPREELWSETKTCLPRVLISGWACRQRTLGDGRRQIVSFLLPGDPCHSLERPSVPGPCVVVALTTVVVADARALEVAINEYPLIYPGLVSAIRLLSIRSYFLLEDQIVRLGRQTAYERMLHLLLEIRERLTVVCMVTKNVFPLPLTQEILADALGLSIVHVNRTLQQIRKDGILEIRGGLVTIIDSELMYLAADFTNPESEFRSEHTLLEVDKFGKLG